MLCLTQIFALIDFFEINWCLSFDSNFSIFPILFQMWIQISEYLDCAMNGAVELTVLSLLMDCLSNDFHLLFFQFHRSVGWAHTSSTCRCQMCGKFPWFSRVMFKNATWINIDVKWTKVNRELICLFEKNFHRAETHSLCHNKFIDFAFIDPTVVV